MLKKFGHLRKLLTLNARRITSESSFISILFPLNYLHTPSSSIVSFSYTHVRWKVVVKFYSIFFIFSLCVFPFDCVCECVCVNLLCHRISVLICKWNFHLIYVINVLHGSQFRCRWNLMVVYSVYFLNSVHNCMRIMLDGCIGVRFFPTQTSAAIHSSHAHTQTNTHARIINFNIFKLSLPFFLMETNFSQLYPNWS